MREEIHIVGLARPVEDVVQGDVRVVVELSTAPSSNWAGAFEMTWREDLPVSEWAHPRIQGKHLLVEVPERSVREVLSAIKAVVPEANLEAERRLEDKDSKAKAAEERKADRGEELGRLSEELDSLLHGDSA
jgi:hypothetical protein